MVEPRMSRVESLLQTAIQTVQWTYIILWQLCPEQGLVWSDGYYNGAIKTRKTVQPSEDSAEEATLQRSQQLRELYESLAAGESSHQPRPPSASLSPEDLTESEWFYLMCVSFSFPPGMGLPGKAYVDRQHIWLTRANEADSKLFSRAILAKSAKIQTVLCIPLLDGVVELGTIEKVEEDIGVIERVKSFFPNPPRPALSEHSTSNPPTSSGPGLYSPAVVVEEEEEEEEEDGVGSDSERAEPLTRPQNTIAEPMQVDTSHEDIRVGSPDYSSNRMDSYVHLLSWDHQALPTPHSEEDAHYSQTVSSILDNQSKRWSKMSSSSAASSAFCKWSARSSSHRHNVLLHDGASQWAVKYILLTVPLLHTKTRDRATVPQDDLNGNHVIAERRRREKLNERFIVLRSMVPFITKMDKASILADTIEYLKQLKKRIQELECTVRQMEADKNSDMKKKKRKMRMVEESPPQEAVEVSIIESDALVEIQCLQRVGLLLDVMQVLGGLGIQVTTVQSSINAGFFTAELRAKVKVKANGRNPSITEVKRTIEQIIKHN